MYFLLDLDGTLVITEDIYFKVWIELLNEYNITLTEELFKIFIQGNNDLYVKNSLLCNVEIDLSELSAKKDELFIKNIEQIKVIEGVYDFLNKLAIEGHECCIVTNCNKKVAEYIVDSLKFNVKFIISSSDSILGKPHPDPYLLAIQKFNTTRDKCVIIEDSKSGLLSGKSVKPKLLIGITTIYDKDELMNYGVDITINNYLDINNIMLHINGC
jgi:HAD superfamily hydrolase (TIGR01509 family)